MILRVAIGQSRAAGLRAVAGVGLGTMIWGAAGFFGVHALFAAAPWLYAGLKLFGGAYLGATHVILPLVAGQLAHILFGNPAYVLTMTGHRLERRGRGYLEAMARHGTTTVEAKTGCGPQENAETKVLRVLAALQVTVIVDVAVATAPV